MFYVFGNSIESTVPGHEGPCYPTWINKNQVCHRIDDGISGFFKNSIFGLEFHGLIKDGKVYDTKIEIYED